MASLHLQRGTLLTAGAHMLRVSSTACTCCLYPVPEQPELPGGAG